MWVKDTWVERHKDIVRTWEKDTWVERHRDTIRTWVKDTMGRKTQGHN